MNFRYKKSTGSPRLDSWYVADTGSGVVLTPGSGSDPGFCSLSRSRSHRVEMPRPGNWEERLLWIKEVREEDLYANYTCLAYSARGIPHASFTLLPAGGCGSGVGRGCF